jgi:hypothetical protein
MWLLGLNKDQGAQLNSETNVLSPLTMNDNIRVRLTGCMHRLGVWKGAY